MIKTKNILKIGVFSIVILSLLISPILKSNVPEVHANGDLQQTQPELWSKIQTNLNESSAVDICDKAFPGGKDNWAIFTNSNEVVQHAVCVSQIGAIEGLGKMFNATINWGIAMTLWAIEPATFGGFVTNKGVTDVGKIIRDFINLFLILGLVFIGIATILGIKKYSWQQTLWKLIVVALLVNFSVIISGMILDVSYFFTYNFLNLAKANNDISVAIKSGFNASSTIDSLANYCLFSEECAGVTVSGGGGSAGAFANGPITSASTSVAVKSGWGLSWGNFFITVIGMILIGLFALIALIAIFVTMILRACIIIALLCLSPIAFAAWIFPDTEKYWKMWWEQFIKWCTFPVIFSLMLYMGITVMNGLFSTIGSGDAAKLGMIAFGIRMVLFSMFLVAGLIFSIQGGGAAAQFVMKQGSKLGLAAGAFMGTRIKEKIVESPIYKKAGQTLTKVPLLKGVGGEMMITGEKVKAARIKEKEKNLENISLGTLKQLEETSLRSPLERGNYEQRIALTNKLAKMGELGDKSIEFIKLHMQDRNFDQLSISRAVPQDFRIKEGIFGETGPTVKEKVQTLGGIKENKILELTQAKEFIKDQVDKAEKQAKEAGKSEKEIEDIKVQKFNEVIQEIVRTLNPAQLNAFWRAISAKTLIEEEWGGPNGKIMQAIDQLDETKKKFHEEMLPISRGLSEISGVTLPKKPLKEKEEPEEWTHFS